ncbi:MAG: transporter related protein [Deltaproteobacteria bacterium]|nr:transporter related protein [Deltaproteobacteria bacterium]
MFPGECVGIVGETGSGKTTLVQHFNGLLKPSGGKVYVEGKDLGRPGISWPELRRRVGLVFQYPEHQLFEETVFEDIAFALRRQKTVPEEEIEARVKSAILLVGLDYETFRQRSPFELSTGEMRRTALAGALVQQPAVLILDEPTVGLDGTGKEEILREIETLHRSGRTIIIISHAVEEVLGLTDRLVVMESGRVLVSGVPSAVFTFLLQENKLTFLVPPIFRLFHELRGCGWSLPTEIVRVEEAILAIDRQLGRARLSSGAGN